jgi:hypothetical protein
MLVERTAAVEYRVGRFTHISHVLIAFMSQEEEWRAWTRTTISWVHFVATESDFKSRTSVYFNGLTWLESAACHSSTALSSQDLLGGVEE